ncbi:hypothetical protein BA899_01130 [Spiribacter sp. SSL99]|nr:hypothetical protein BA899_01130 [Spiribacter sp. SSL99]
MLIVTETRELWSFRDFCRSEHAKPIRQKSYGTNHAMDDLSAKEEVGRWVTYSRLDGTAWCVAIASDGRVSFLVPCDESEKASPDVDSRYSTRAGVLAPGRLLGVLLAILRRRRPASLPEVSFDPESPALGMVFRHMTQNPWILDAFRQEGLHLVGVSGESIRFRRHSRHRDTEGR